MLTPNESLIGLPLVWMTTPFVVAGQDRRIFDISANSPRDLVDDVECHQPLHDIL